MPDSGKLESGIHIVTTLIMAYTIAYLLHQTSDLGLTYVAVISTLVSKIIVGDWDIGYWQWTLIDLGYWPALLVASYLGWIAK